MIKGWLFDVYPLDNKMIFWVKQENGKAVRLEDNSWSHCIYVASEEDDNSKSNLINSILERKQGDQNDNIICLIKDYELVSKYEKITDTKESTVLKLTLIDSTKALSLAKKIERTTLHKFGNLRLYNVDLLPAQSYFYEHDIFPSAFCEVSCNNSSRHSKLTWINKDNVHSLDYKLPDFKVIHLKVNLKREGKIPRYTDRIDSILIEERKSEEEDYISSFEIQSESEENIIEDLIAEVTKKIDPDFIFTEDGDSFTFPYLIHRAEKSTINLVLGREQTIPLKKPKKEGISYFSYGRVYFRPTTMKLLGRIHLDKNNSFVWNESGLQGLYEISRLCRMPLHTASRASIGKCLSSLQFYYAITKKNTLIPWKPTLAEHFKTYEELLIADRGGFIFEPEIGVHEQVAEFDFISLYPNIMLKKNLSAETINCNCCTYHGYTRKVPELLDYHICQKTGIVPMSLKIVLDKRKEYKRLVRSDSLPQDLKPIYDSRQNALKWILVTSFGYLGFNNAKFGRIDAHIAVCAFDRQILLRAAKIVERYGFRVLHGIVDSIWIKKKKNDAIPGKKQEEYDYLRLKEHIEKETGFEISFEGIYKWIAFVHSKVNANLPVPNRYFGVFENGSIKVRGIEARRHDTPHFFSKFQQEILAIMAEGNNINEVKALMPKVRQTFQKYLRLLKDRNVPIEELVFTKQLSKDSNKYQINRNTIENDALHQLEMEGQYLKAGQLLRYIITNYYGKHSPNKFRTIPMELIDEKNTTYDVTRYAELLAETCNSVTESFGNTSTDGGR
ncbi:MAG TPA: DNA polymerase domain-containing protein [Nitrososphaeraceae archaeon]|nr:DNA polymerase domain-containing protein [Nitrososphaeraceae archaeon]